MKKYAVLFGICLILYGYYDKIVLSTSPASEQSCYKYASQFSCDFIINKATYQVYYWKDVNNNNNNDEKWVGTATGIRACRDTAVYAHRQEMSRRKNYNSNWSESDNNWSERSYICVLEKEGRTEKHRVI